MESCNTYTSCFSTFHTSLLDIPQDSGSMLSSTKQQQTLPSPSSASTLNQQQTSSLITKIVAELTPLAVSAASPTSLSTVTTVIPQTTASTTSPVDLLGSITGSGSPSIASSSNSGNDGHSSLLSTTDDQAPLLAQNVYINPLYKSDAL